MPYYKLKPDSELLGRILRAEKLLSELNLSIGYTQASDGIHITDTLTGNLFFCRDKEYNFPRSCDSEFLVYRD